MSNLISVQGGSRDNWLQETALLFQATRKTMAGFLPSTKNCRETKCVKVSAEQATIQNTTVTQTYRTLLHNLCLKQ